MVVARVEMGLYTSAPPFRSLQDKHAKPEETEKIKSSSERMGQGSRKGGTGKAWLELSQVRNEYNCELSQTYVRSKHKMQILVASRTLSG